jgi:hypothetical protein
MNPAPIPWILCFPGFPPEMTGESAGEVLWSFCSLYFRLGGCLAASAERVEQILRMPPLPDPPEESPAAPETALR